MTELQRTTPAYRTDISTAAGRFTLGTRRTQRIGGRVPRRTMRRELEAKGMTREEAEEFLTAHGFPRPQQAKRRGKK